MSINGAKSQSKVGMKDCAGNFTPERTEELRKKVDFSDIPEIKDDKNHVFLNPALLDKPAEDEKETRLERLIDDASPDTDLNDEDEAWLKAHSSDD